MKIRKTQDYTLFKRISGNRKVSQPHIQRLLEAIKEDPQTITYNPIIVNSDMEVIDGQHRLEAIKALELPVYFIQVDDIGLEVVQKLNSINKSWSPMDYAKSFKEVGNENYAIYIDFKKEFGLNHDNLMRYLAQDIPMTGTLFKNGKFKVQDVAKAYELCVYLRDISQYYDRAKLRNAANGFYMVAISPNYDHKRMVRQMKSHGDKFQEQALANDYAREYERIYNFRQRKDERLF